LTMLYRSTHRLCRAGAPVENLAHSASFHSLDKIAPSNPGIKHLGACVPSNGFPVGALGLCQNTLLKDSVHLVHSAWSPQNFFM